MKRLSFLMLFIVTLSGCAGIDTNPTVGTTYSILTLAGAAVKLHSLDEAQNIAGIEAISQEYQVDVATPAVALFTAADSMIEALKQLQQSMRARRGFTSQDSADELERVLTVPPPD